MFPILIVYLCDVVVVVAVYPYYIESISDAYIVESSLSTSMPL